MCIRDSIKTIYLYGSCARGEEKYSSDVDLFLELMEKNSLAMYKVARGILDNDEDAADAMQDTILTLSLIHIWNWMMQKRI